MAEIPDLTALVSPIVEEMGQMPSGEVRNRGAVEKCFPYVSLTASIADAIEVMQQAKTDYVLVVDDFKQSANLLCSQESALSQSTAIETLGLLTQQAIVQEIAASGNLSSCDLTALPIRSIVQPALTLSEAEAEDISRVFLMFQQHQLSHLPVLDAVGQVSQVFTMSDVRDTCMRLYAEQEAEIQHNTGQLRLVIEFEAILRRIVDHIRSWLDEARILQTAVEELGAGLGINSCNIALYDLEQGTSTILYEYNPPVIPFRGRTARLAHYPEFYDQLLQGQSVQFCNLQPNPIRGRRAILACPIFDDRQVLGDIWLINDRDYSYRSYEIRLVQQVANQCAIGLRQSRLYQAVQQQVEELTRLNLLKDDFLSTVSHELRSPITNAKMAAQMLEIVLQKANMLNPELPRPLDRYLQILKDECQREISLINNLLDLTRLNDESEPLRLTAVDLSLLIPQITQGFLERIQNQNQELIYKLPPDLPLVQTEVAALERVLIELVNNACKYTPPQEKIIIRVQVAPQTLQISICNTGIEIPEAERSRIFDRFYRIPNNDPWKHGGTGLGLALVRKLTERLKGTICLQVGSNQTTFVIELPRAIEE